MQYSDQTIRWLRNPYEILANDRKFDQYSDQKILKTIEFLWNSRRMIRILESNLHQSDMNWHNFNEIFVVKFGIKFELNLGWNKWTYRMLVDARQAIKTWWFLACTDLWKYSQKQYSYQLNLDLIDFKICINHVDRKQLNKWIWNFIISPKGVMKIKPISKKTI